MVSAGCHVDGASAGQWRGRAQLTNLADEFGRGYILAWRTAHGGTVGTGAWSAPEYDSVRQRGSERLS